jgi:hypothetical protein
VFNNFQISNESSAYQNFHQIIPYCIRPLSKTEGREVTMTRGNISSNFTFDQLKKQNVTTQDLLLWFAPIDLIERYQNYLDTSTLALASELFYNCTLLWFGPFCQYTFDSNEPFSKIVFKTFIAKGNGTNGISVQNITNLTCYMHLQCNRGPAPICLDWREICDGRIDCLGDGIDERQCIDLEINECGENEYRCHNGMCIPEQFINDNPHNPDCLDHTDENDNIFMKIVKVAGFVDCFQNPGFPCEESDPFIGFRGFVCGDGQQMKISILSKALDPTKQEPCSNGRDFILIDSVLSDALFSSNLTFECQIVMACITSRRYGFDCIRQLCAIQGFPCLLHIHNVCNQSSYVILPMLPIIQGYAQFGYWTNEVITYESLAQFPMPNFVCFDKQRCLFISSTFKIDNLACFNFSNTDPTNLDYMGVAFHTCLPVDESGNETNCFHPSLFHCPKTSKCISKHRLLDGIDDCPGGADELYTESCNLSHRHRFRCTSENKCISPVLMHDYVNHCHEGEDENLRYKQKLQFQYLCDEYTDLPALLIDGKNETDETNCEQWPCDNPYTRCDGAWTCPNGADEINCNSTSKCYPNHHECVSPSTFKIICLPMDRAGDGNVDCLGATDEREHCRRMYPGQPWWHYRCWNDTSCTTTSCFGLNQCQFETSNYIQKICQEDQHIAEVIKSAMWDYKLGGSLSLPKQYFVLHNTSRFQSNTSFTSLIMADDSWDIPTGNISHIHTEFLFKVRPKEIDFHDAWICNRGIVVFVGIQKNEQCLCPPSYYGNRCQFQNQRISLTLQFGKECAPSCHGVYGIVLTLVDNDQDIHSYEQLTYISTNNCTMKYNLYLLYRFRPKNLTKNYSIHIDGYCR